MSPERRIKTQKTGLKAQGKPPPRFTLFLNNSYIKKPKNLRPLTIG